MAHVNASFTGSIPEFYDSCLGPAYFEAFAADLAQRLPAKPAGDVLEIACGTGIVTRRVRERVDPAIRLVATDLSAAMLDYARAKLDDCRGIEWREADAVNLPFANAAYGAAICSFGVMFVPDKKAVFREARRVLKQDGILLFTVWDRIEDNPHALTYTRVIESLFPGDAEMRFTIPFDMHDPALLRELLAEAGFGKVRIETKRHQMESVSARTLATGQIRGTPRSLQIERRGMTLEEVVEKETAALAQVGGADPCRVHAQALVVEARAI